MQATQHAVLPHDWRLSKADAAVSTAFAAVVSHQVALRHFLFKSSTKEQGIVKEVWNKWRLPIVAGRYSRGSGADSRFAAGAGMAESTGNKR